MWSIWKKLRKLSDAGEPRPGFRAELLSRLHVNPDWPSKLPVRPAVPTLRWATAIAVVVLVLTGGGAYVYASPAVAADHALFPVKRSFEVLGRRLQKNPIARARFEKKILHRRLDEMEYAKRPAPVVAANQELVQFIKEIKSLPREERRAAIAEIKERVRERKLEVQTELLNESYEEILVPMKPAPPLPLSTPEAQIVPTDTVPIKELEVEKLPEASATNTTIEVPLEIKQP